jgi:hypothetical protein
VNGIQCAKTIIPSQNGAATTPTSCTTSSPRITFSMPSPVEEIQLVIQYQRNVGTWSAANRIGRTGASSSAGAVSGVATRRAYPTLRWPSRWRVSSRM